MSEVMLEADVALPPLTEKLVIAPATGRFEPLPPEIFTTEGEWVEIGQTLGRILGNGPAQPVTSAFRGWVMGMLARPGQPVRAGEALFWVRVA